MLQCVADVLTYMRTSLFSSHTALQYVAVCCSVLQCVAVCCSVLQMCWRTCARLHVRHALMYATHVRCVAHVCIAWHTCAHPLCVCGISTCEHLHCVCGVSISANLYICTVCVPSAHLYGVSFAKEPYERDDILHIYTFPLTCAHLHCVYRASHDYKVATMSRLLKIIGLFCKRALWKRRYSAKETYNLKEPPIHICIR